jgi:hypothetical protein
LLHIFESASRQNGLMMLVPSAEFVLRRQNASDKVAMRDRNLGMSVCAESLQQGAWQNRGADNARYGLCSRASQLVVAKE